MQCSPSLSNALVPLTAELPHPSSRDSSKFSWQMFCFHRQVVNCRLILQVEISLVWEFAFSILENIIFLRSNNRKLWMFMLKFAKYYWSRDAPGVKINLKSVEDPFKTIKTLAQTSGRVVRSCRSAAVSHTSQESHSMRLEENLLPQTA